MKTKESMQFLVTVGLLFSAITAVAQNRVVVVPLLGDDPQPIANVVTVAKENGDFTSPITALNSINDASQSSPYIVAIAPGEYQLGAGQVIMKPFVELIGSGKVATRLVASRGSGTDDASAAVIVGADNSTISDLSIENTRTNSNSFGIYNGAADIKIQHVSMTMNSGPASGFQVGILNDGSNVKISHAEIELNDGGQQIALFSRNASVVEIEKITTRSSGGNSFQYGLLGFGAKTKINHATIEVTGGSSRQWGYSAGGAPGIDNTLELNHVHISLSSGTSGDQIGAELATQGPNNNTIINNSKILVDGSTAAYAAGISLTQSGELVMTNTEISASGATEESQGVVQNIGTTSTIRGSKIFGTDSSVFLGGPGTPALAYVSDSFLEGGTDLGSGNFRCSFVFNEFGGPLDNACSTGP